MLGHLKGAVGHDVVLHHVLDLLHGGGAVHLLALQLHGLRDPLDLHRRHPVHLLHGLVGLGDGDNDLGNIEADLGAVSLYDPHKGFLLRSLLSLAPHISGRVYTFLPYHTLYLVSFQGENSKYREDCCQKAAEIFVYPAQNYCLLHKIWYFSSAKCRDIRAYWPTPLLRPPLFRAFFPRRENRRCTGRSNMVQ